ncbi:MAG: XRE family transcriptional regulator [Spirochaetia bacterium]|nr:XRE family transcriptional regulator [Spirochaetia bacterium]
MNHQEFKKILFKDKKLKNAYNNPDVFFQVANSLQLARIKRGLSQAKLASLVGMQQAAIARLENPGYSVKYLKTLEKIARALKAQFIPPQIKIEEAADKASAIRFEVHENSLIRVERCRLDNSSISMIDL